MSAPAHEEELLALHRHGSAMGELPTWFWFFLGTYILSEHTTLGALTRSGARS